MFFGGCAPKQRDIKKSTFELSDSMDEAEMGTANEASTMELVVGVSVLEKCLPNTFENCQL